jgi:plasmid stabilization system protein ParE
MRVIFSALAQQELEDAVAYYDLQHPGLGKRFRHEVRSALLRISRYPRAWSVERGDIRRCLLLKFPYKLLYSIEPGGIFVVAVAHQHRMPEYWVAE